MAASKIRIKKICEYCGQEFYALKTSTRFCSKLCNDRAYKMRQRVNTVKKAESENVTVSQERTFSVINQKEYLSAFKKSFISLTSICSDIQQKHPTMNICSKG